ncbi:hypothetical protein TNCV_3226731 [Trichonephila clavipes]|nr:hypothetical protein TNCV_3226731 [Trichonephila clavipes]
MLLLQRSDVYLDTSGYNNHEVTLHCCIPPGTFAMLQDALDLKSHGHEKHCFSDEYCIKRSPDEQGKRIWKCSRQWWYTHLILFDTQPYN